MEAYLEHRFFMGSTDERKKNAWINPPKNTIDTKHRPSNHVWFSWRVLEQSAAKRGRQTETLDQWIKRIAPDTIKHLLDPDYAFFTDACAIAVTVSSFMKYVEIYQQVFNRNEVTDEARELYRKLHHMYVLRLRHDMYELPCYIKGVGRIVPIPNTYHNMFANIPELANPPSVDLDGFHWTHPAVPEDTHNVRYFWNMVKRGEPIKYRNWTSEKNDPWRFTTTKS